MITFQNLSKTYQSKGLKVEALKNISLSLPDKGMVFLLGKSGCGKSTFLNILGGLDTATEGDLIIDRKNIRELTQEQLNDYRNTYVGFVFQEYNLLEPFTVAENLSLAVELQGKKCDKESVQSLLKKLDIADVGERKPSTLSGGQRQRIAIARAILKDSKILLADEPTGALDSHNATEIFKILKELSKEKLIIVVSHDREFAKTYADRIIELRDGKIIADFKKGKPESCEAETQFLPRKAKMPFGRVLKIAFSSLQSKVVRRSISVILASFAFLLFAVSSSLLFFDARSTVSELYAESATATPLVQITGLKWEENKGGTSYQTVRLSEEDVAELSAIGKFHGVMHLGANTFRNAQCDISDLFTKELTPEGEAFCNYLGVSPEYVKNNITDVAGFAAGLQEEVSLVCGRAPALPHEVVISSYLFDVFSIFGFKEYTLNEDWNQEKEGALITLHKPEDILNKQIVFYNCDGDTYYVPLTVVGVFQADAWAEDFNKAYAEKMSSFDEYRGWQALLSSYTSGYQSLIWVADGFQERYASYNRAHNDGIHPVGEGVYDYALCSVENLSAVLNKIVFPSDRDKKAQGWQDGKGYTLYDVDNYFIDELLSLMENIDTLSGIFLGISALLAVFAVLLLTSLIAVSMEQKQKDVSILRALGASKRDIFTLFFTESLFVSVLSVALSFIAFALLGVFANDFFAANFFGFGIFYFCWQTVLLTPLLAVGVAFIATLFPVQKITKKSPAELLKN